MTPIFYFDLASPEAYLAAERMLQANTDRARADGVRSLPAVVIGGEVLEGERAIPA